MLRVLVNIRGCNGVGKSTPIHLMKETDPDWWVLDNKDWKLSIFPKYKWVALGSYHNKTGGMDGIANKIFKQEALAYAWENYPKFDVVMEGVLDSTIRSTYIDLFKYYQERVGQGLINPRKIIVLNFIPPLEVAIQRVYERNGGKPVKEEQIESKWKTVERNVQFFRDAGICTLKYDTSKIAREEMLDKFLSIVERNR